MRLGKIGHAVLFSVEIAAIVFLIGKAIDFHFAPKTAEERLEDFDAVKVAFDADGGQCADGVRFVKVGDPYGASMNLYPSEDRRYFRNLNATTLNADDGSFAISLQSENGENWFADYCTTNAIPEMRAGEVWTYVVDVVRFKGELGGWDIGQTWPTNKDVYAQLSCAHIGTNVVSGTKIFKQLTAMPFERCNFLDRAYLYAKPWQSFEIKFRVSLFAGMAINASNYHYVNPGETLKCPLPVPTRSGYTFLGWYDGDRKIEADSKVMRRDAHTLKAKWRKM